MSEGREARESLTARRVARESLAADDWESKAKERESAVAAVESMAGTGVAGTGALEALDWDFLFFAAGMVSGRMGWVISLKVSA